ncbi:MAG: transposase [Candidatus Desantisbacteria bacterium]
MGRPLRIEYAGAHYHVMSRGNEQKDVFRSQGDREQFLSYLESAVSRYGAVIHVYCLMSNHYHLLVETPSGNLSQIMKHINGAYTNYFNVKRKRAGHLFQGRYKAILIEANEYAQELSRYIHLNPVRAMIVSMPEEYQWSSYRDYIGQRKAPNWLKTEFISGYFDKRVSDAQRKYRTFVENLIEQKYESPLKATIASTILGSDEFVKEITESYVDGKQLDRDLSAIRTLSSRPSIDKIMEAVNNVLGQNRLSRKAVIYFSHKFSGAKLKEIGERFNMGESAVSQASRRFAQHVEKDGNLKKVVKELEGMLNLSNV